MIIEGRWRAHHTTGLYGKRPTPGQIIALDFTAWRVKEIRDVLPLDTENPQYIIEAVPLDRTGEEGEVHILTVTEPAGRKRSWDLLPEHYVVCGKCGDLPPCREVWADKQAQYAAERLDRYDNPGFCPACQEPISLRQKTFDFPNIVSPLGGTVTFHRRDRCFSSACRYEEQLVAAGVLKHTTLTCKGNLIKHRDGTRECHLPHFEDECPGSDAYHGSWQLCAYRSHGCPRLECNLVG